MTYRIREDPNGWEEPQIEWSPSHPSPRRALPDREPSDYELDRAEERYHEQRDHINTRNAHERQIGLP